MIPESEIQESLMTIKANGTWEFGFSSAIRLSNLEATSQGDARSDSTSAEVEQAVAALASCTCMLMPAVAQEIGFRHNGVDFTGKAEFSIDNINGTGGAVRRFEAVEGIVTVRTDETTDRLADLASEVEKRCRVLGVLENAGIRTHLEWKAAESAERAMSHER